MPTFITRQQPCLLTLTMEILLLCYHLMCCEEPTHRAPNTNLRRQNITLVSLPPIWRFASPAGILSAIGGDPDCDRSTYEGRASTRVRYRYVSRCRYNSYNTSYPPPKAEQLAWPVSRRVHTGQTCLCYHLICL